MEVAVSFRALTLRWQSSRDGDRRLVIGRFGSRHRLDTEGRETLRTDGHRRVVIWAAQPAILDEPAGQRITPTRPYKRQFIAGIERVAVPQRRVGGSFVPAVLRRKLRPQNGGHACADLAPPMPSLTVVLTTATSKRRGVM
jgi:hypothetical protein